MLVSSFLGVSLCLLQPLSVSSVITDDVVMNIAGGSPSSLIKRGMVWREVMRIENRRVGSLLGALKAPYARRHARSSTGNDFVWSHCNEDPVESSDDEGAEGAPTWFTLRGLLPTGALRGEPSSPLGQTPVIRKRRHSFPSQVISCISTPSSKRSSPNSGSQEEEEEEELRMSAMFRRFEHVRRNTKAGLTYLRPWDGAHSDSAILLRKIGFIGSSLLSFSLPGESVEMATQFISGLEDPDDRGLPLPTFTYNLKKEASGLVTRREGIIVYGTVPTMATVQVLNKAPLSERSSFLDLPENIRDDLVLYRAETTQGRSLSFADLDKFMEKAGFFGKKHRSSLLSRSTAAASSVMGTPVNSAAKDARREVKHEANQSWPQQIWVFVPLTNAAQGDVSVSMLNVVRYIENMHLRSSPALEYFQEKGFFYKPSGRARDASGHEIFRFYLKKMRNPRVSI